MKRLWAWTGSVWLWSCCVLAWGGEPTSLLLDRCAAVRIDLSFGRILATNLRLGANRNLATQRVQGTVQESLAITATSTSPVVRYEFSDGQRQIQFDLSPERVVIEQRGSANAAESLSLRQAAKGPLILRREPMTASRIGVGGEVHGRSLWHLLLGLPDAPREELLRMLDAVLPSWRLAETLAAIDEGLQNVARQADLPDPEHVQSLLQQLASTEFRRRQAADKQLRELGPGIVGLLGSADAEGLDNEQRLRVRAIRDYLLRPGMDTPDRVVAWLATDRRLWLQQLDATDPQRREWARDHLARLCDFPCEFDPRADEPTRTAQIARLRKRLRND